MGYVLSAAGFSRAMGRLGEDRLIYAPQLKRGEGRFADVDVVRYDFTTDVSAMELERRSDYPFKEVLAPLSQTLFFFTEDDVKVADADEREVVVVLRACDLNAVRRLDALYLENGRPDPFYQRLRSRMRFALLGCDHSQEDCFCVSMGTNVATGYDLSFDRPADGGGYRVDVKADDLRPYFVAEATGEEDVTPAHVASNDVSVRVPEAVPNAIYGHDMWNEYTERCITCGRCNLVCPTCTCFTMQDAYYTDNGRVGERRRVMASCMIDGYTDVAGGGSYRKAAGDRMRFKVLHKVYDFRRRFGFDMCVGCGRCDTVCPEYISFSGCINKLADAVDGLARDASQGVATNA